MSPLLTSLVAFGCIFGGAFLGIFIRYRLPDRHLSGDTKDIVRQGAGLIATLGAGVALMAFIIILGSGVRVPLPLPYVARVPTRRILQ